MFTCNPIKHHYLHQSHHIPYQSAQTIMMRHGLALRSSRRLLLASSECSGRTMTTSVAASAHHRRYTMAVGALGKHPRFIHIQPLPMPAVAHYDYADEYEEDEVDIGSCDTMSITSILRGGGDTSSSHNGGSIGESGNNNGSTRFVGGGGGGNGGPHRCPKCGATVTFQGSASNKSIQNNCFYCAACSGWFLVQPNNTEMSSAAAASAHSKYLLSKLANEGAGAGKEIPTTASSGRKITDPQFVMQHVSLIV